MHNCWPLNSLANWTKYIYTYICIVSTLDALLHITKMALWKMVHLGKPLQIYTDIQIHRQASRLHTTIPVKKSQKHKGLSHKNIASYKITSKRLKHLFFPGFYPNTFLYSRFSPKIEFLYCLLSSVAPWGGPMVDTKQNIFEI